tara:strand:- start:256 stop:570 length:315 start_codon:yes stop_codon:yes gene_type:complete
MSNKIKTRISLEKKTAQLRMMVFHPMESGLRKDPVSKKLIERHFINVVNIKKNDTVVVEAHLSRSVSRNPFLHFTVYDVEVGDKFLISWKDNFGDSGKTEIVVK